MKLTVLVDNNTYIDHYYHGEPALSFFIEDGEEKILFDTGYSSVFLKNAEKLNLNLKNTTKIVLSHGHNDHTGGLFFLDSFFNIPPELIAHPDTFFAKKYDGEDIGSIRTMEELKQDYSLILSKNPVKISKNLTFLGEIPSLVDFEPRKQVGEIEHLNSFEPDYVFDDSAIVFEGKHGIYVITGCSHSGISNICEYAKQVTGNNRLLGVIGGFHLFDVDEQLARTVDYFKDNQVNELYPCHCVSFSAKASIHAQIPVTEVGVGMQLEWE